MNQTAHVPNSTGIEGLDLILQGGLIPARTYLIEGTPGAGKTTLSMQFLLEGLRRGEKCLYVTLSESTAELEASARSHGWDLDGIEIREYIISDASVERDEELTMFHSSEVELGSTMSRILRAIEASRPRRVVIDALSELRLLSESTLRYRRQLLALKKFFAERECTVLVLDDGSGAERDSHVESIVHGVISLEHALTEYGVDRRRLRVRKLRARGFQTGLHDYVIRTGGLQIFPRLVAAQHATTFTRRALESDIGELNQLLGGGPQTGTSTLLIGPAGSGKTTIAMQYAVAAARRGERATVYMFDELRGLLLDRLRDIRMDIQDVVQSGTLSLRQIDPTEMSPGEFASLVRADVEQAGATVVVIDSLNGYLNSMPHEHFLTAQLHELLSYLGQRGVATILIVGQQGIVGSNMRTPVDASYLADSIVLFRFFEAGGEVRKAISVTKKRGGAHENTVRELTIDSQGVRLGHALTEYRGGVLTGSPVLDRAMGN
jgi:circadian clock protein KaiC